MALAKLCRYCKKGYRWNGDAAYEYMCSACTHEFYQLTLEFADKVHGRSRVHADVQNESSTGRAAAAPVDRN